MPKLSMSYSPSDLFSDWGRLKDACLLPVKLLLAVVGLAQSERFHEVGYVRLDSPIACDVAHVGQYTGGKLVLGDHVSDVVVVDLVAKLPRQFHDLGKIPVAAPLVPYRIDLPRSLSQGIRLLGWNERRRSGKPEEPADPLQQGLGTDHLFETNNQVLFGRNLIFKLDSVRRHL